MRHWAADEGRMEFARQDRVGEKYAAATQEPGILRAEHSGADGARRDDRCLDVLQRFVHQERSSAGAAASSTAATMVS
ncbi:hypothetical protein GCM10011492_09280 [Flexivirga endophytica]|uniref:Uncharacterized protein n=1 Tax=Flexivirga endophytica TaxID=1849103 RepID=A0A916T009_9MICO|nr:hypothetical protein GCM10011492_09280 [Flexivirga endophytica]GHB59142.1 hypothetical protein GCM10008112_30300 [Flexivirga endophytica]